jgi:hypothetical protein
MKNRRKPEDDYAETHVLDRSQESKALAKAEAEALYAEYVAQTERDPEPAKLAKPRRK